MKTIIIKTLAGMPVIASVLACFFGIYVLITLGISSWITFLYIVMSAITIAYNAISIDHYIELEKKFFKMLSE